MRLLRYDCLVISMCSCFSLLASMYELQEMMRDSEVLRAFHAPVDQVFYRGLHPLPIGKSLFDFMQNAPYEVQTAQFDSRPHLLADRRISEVWCKWRRSNASACCLCQIYPRYVHLDRLAEISIDSLGDLVTYLLFQHFDGPSLLKEVDIAGNSPLHIACIKGALEIRLYLLNS